MATQVVPGVYCVTGLRVGRVYLVEGEDGVIVIDASMKGSAEKIVAQAEALGHGRGDVKHILITHAHPDHVDGLPELQEMTGAQVFASTIEKPFVEGTEPVPRPDREALKGLWRLAYVPPALVTGTPVDRTFADGETLPGGLQAVATPGHAPGHASFWDAERGILFIGDVVFHLGPFGIRLPPPPFTADMEEDRRSLARVVSLEPAVVCFGHGEPLVEGAAETLREAARRIGAV